MALSFSQKAFFISITTSVLFEVVLSTSRIFGRYSDKIEWATYGNDGAEDEKIEWGIWLRESRNMSIVSFGSELIWEIGRAVWLSKISLLKENRN